MAAGTDFETTRAGAGTTLWSEVHRASDVDPVRRRAALESLGQTYWPALFALARRRGLGSEDAQDAVQEFFARLIEKNGFRSADPARGRFRTWLRVAFGYFLSDEGDRRSALKRGGGRPALSLEADLVAEHRETPDRQFDRDWARLVLRRGMDALQAELERTDRADHFDLLRATLGSEDPSMEALARRFGLAVQDVKNRLFRARRRLRELMLQEVRGHLENPADAASELRHLSSSIG